MDLEKNEIPCHCAGPTHTRKSPHILLRMSLALTVVTIFYVLPFDQIAERLASMFFADETMLDEAWKQLIDAPQQWATALAQSGTVLSFSKAWMATSVSLAIFAPGTSDCNVAMVMSCLLTVLGVVTSLFLRPN